MHPMVNTAIIESIAKRGIHKNESSQNTMQHNSCADSAKSSKCQIFSKGRAELRHEAVDCYHEGHTPSWLIGQHQPRWVRSKRCPRRNYGNRLQQADLKSDLLNEACHTLSDFQDVSKHFWWLGCSSRPIEYWIASKSPKHGVDQRGEYLSGGKARFQTEVPAGMNIIRYN